MIGGTVTHLLPSVPPVTVGAEQPQVASVGFPIAQAIIPGSRSPLFQAAVDVVNVENAKVGLPALNARPAKLRNERQLPAPVARVLVPLVRMDRPVGVATGNRAKAMLAGLPALLARLAALPSRSKIAGLAAVFSGAISQAVEMSFKRLGALRAGDFGGALFHGRSIAQTAVQPKYFDIACKRIEDAQRQGDFFVERAA
jgi:hypothetical protein